MKLIKMLPDRVQIKTDELEFADIRLNDLVKISDDEVSLVTMVCGMTDTDLTPDLGEEDYITAAESVKVIDCRIIGSLKKNRFCKAIDRYPTTMVRMERLTGTEFSRMLKSQGGACFTIGKYTDYHCAAWIDGNKFFQRHACVVGNTGAGKSETVARILEEAAGLPGANLVVFDIHGEYGHLSYADNLKIGEELSFPIWMFGFSGMVANILKVREESSSVAMAALRKCYYACGGANENKPVYFDYRKILTMLQGLNVQQVGTGEVYKTGDKAGMEKTTKGDFNGRLSGLINTMEAKLHDRRYGFLFTDDGQECLARMISRVMGGEKPVKVIDLSCVPHDVAIPVIGVITKLVYELQRMRVGANKPITLVCDEAHVYIPNGLQLSASERRMVETFEDIAKEGRKFGITLFVASQRPSELNKTIMAQCANFIVGKLNNESDKSMVKGMLPDGNEDVVDGTTMFAPGDVLLIGDASPIPLKVHVELAKERPRSRTIAFWDEWGQTARDSDYAPLVAEYLKD